MQVVDYETAAFGDSSSAALWIADEGEAHRLQLEAGDELAYGLGIRHCAGTRDGPRHKPCENDTAPCCDVHTDRWACARCVGQCDLPLASCREEHAVYLAAFAPDTVKVGVTRSWRLQTRLREQGADRAAHLQTVEDGRRARQIEADIATDLGDSVRVPAKIRGLHRSVDESTWSALLDEYDAIATYDFDYGFDLPERPVEETLASGTIRGTQGRVLVLDRAGSTYAVDMRNLVGHHLTERDDRALQSSFGAFE